MVLSFELKLQSTKHPERSVSSEPVSILIINIVNGRIFLRLFPIIISESIYRRSLKPFCVHVLICLSYFFSVEWPVRVVGFIVVKPTFPVSVAVWYFVNSEESNI